MARLPTQSRLTASATSLVIAYAAAAVAILLGLTGPVRNAEDSSLDWRFLWRGPVGPKAADIVLVTLDEGDSLAYRNPLPRRRLAGIVEQLHAGGAGWVGFDVYLDGPSFDPVGDSLLVAALERAGNVVLVSRLERGGDCGWTEKPPAHAFGAVAADRGYATFLTGTDGEIVRRGQVALACQQGHLLSLAGVLDPKMFVGTSVTTAKNFPATRGRRLS